MGKKLYFIRHGETPANASRTLQGCGIDQDLSEKGLKQAERLRDRLKDLKIDLFVTSNMKVHYQSWHHQTHEQRAKQTAQIVREFHSSVPLLVRFSRLLR